MAHCRTPRITEVESANVRLCGITTVRTINEVCFKILRGKTSRLSMISLLRRNRKKTPKAQQLADQEQQRPPQHQQSRQQRPATRNHLSERFSQPQPSVELYNDTSLDSLVFAASLGLVSTHQTTRTTTKVLVVPREPNRIPPKKQVEKNQGQQQSENSLEFQCRFCGKGYRWKSTMRRHETLECGDKPPSFQCPQCAYRARQRGNLTVHIKRHHMKD